jgi:class 3 adenylate cyclase
VAGEIILSQPTHDALTSPVECEALEPATVKGRHTPVIAFRIPREGA